MKLSKTKIVAVVLAALVFFPLVSFAVYCVRRNTFISSYRKLQPGDSKKLVVDSLGQPAEIARCGDSQATDELNFRCREGYWYYSVMERWIIYLDQDGKVIGKSYAVSY